MNISQITPDNQRLKDWRIERLGKWTGSRIANLMTSSRKKGETFGQTSLDFIYEIMSERNVPSEVIINEDLWDQYLSLTSVTTKEMQFGTDNEDDAIAAFDEWLHRRPDILINSTRYLTADLIVVRGGSQDHPTIPNFSASPDAVVYHKETGEVLSVVEVKVPAKPKNFIKYRSEVHDAETLRVCNPVYYHQTHAEMMVTETTRCYFVAYHPFIIRGLHVASIDLNPDTASAIASRIAEAEALIQSLETPAPSLARNNQQ